MNKWVVIIIGALVILGVMHYFMNLEIEEYEPYEDLDYTKPWLLPHNQTTWLTGYWINTSDLEYTSSNEDIEIKLVIKVNESYKDCLVDWIVDGSWLENITCSGYSDFEIVNFEWGDVYN